jgi:hypothetical protein
MALNETKSESETAKASWLDNLGRRHPGWFDALLVLLAVIATVAILSKTNYTLILYQGF